MPGCRVETITPDGPDLLHVDARGTGLGGRCPACGCASRAVHSRYRRRPADLPSVGRRVHVGLRVRRFYCRNAKCARRNFAERLPWLHTTHARLRRLPALSADVAAMPIMPRRDQAFRRTGPERAARAESSARWQARYEEVQRRHGAGEPLLAISRAMGLARAIVRKFARADSFPVRSPRGPRPSIIDSFLPHLERRLAAGCENGLVLWRELRGLGFPGGSKQVHRWLAERRTVPARVRRPRTEDPGDRQAATAGEKKTPLPGPRQLARHGFAVLASGGSLRDGCWSSPSRA